LLVSHPCSRFSFFFLSHVFTMAHKIHTQSFLSVQGGAACDCRRQL
jgi:hypothetical protein